MSDSELAPGSGSDPVLDAQRRTIHAILVKGLVTQWRERAYEDADVRRAVTHLQDLATAPLEARLRAAGFTLTPYIGNEDPEIEQSCGTCMYYESHRRYCNLPELKVGVEPQWSCILWRV